MTRQQRFMSRALADVAALDEDARARPAAKRIYGGLCHTTPVLVRTNGLCQTIAFIEEKAASTNPHRKRAYQTLRRHIAGTLGVAEDRLLPTIRDAPLGDYVRYTRTLLEAWVYYKRFAVSILDVQPGEGDDDAIEDGGS